MPKTIYKSRDQIDNKYKWDLEFLLENKTLDQNLEILFKKIKELFSWKEKKYNNLENFVAYLKLQDKTTILINKISNYLSNKLNEDVTNSYYNKKSEELSYQLYLLEQEQGAENYLFFKNANKIESWLDNPLLKDYKFGLKNTLRAKDHQLNKEQEEFWIKISRAEVSTEKIFDILVSSEIENNYGYINKNNKKIKVCEANRNPLSKNDDKQIRKQSSLLHQKAFLEHKNTLSNLLYEKFKKNSTWAKVLNYKDSIDYLTFSDNVNEQFLETLYEVIIEQKDIFKPYFSYYKKFYKKKFNEKISDYDWNRDLIKVKNRFSIEQAQKLVLDSLKSFDNEYYDVAKKALLKDNWVDYFPNLNKKSGAYSIGSTFGIDKKLILMNFDHTFSSVETLAHELGHSMHSYFSDENNSLNHSQYSIFLAEIASIFNELLLYDHLLTTSDDDKLKFYILTKSINGFIATVYRQVEWSNYEYGLYKLIDSGQALNTFESLSDLYYKNNIKYSFSKKPKPKDKNNLLFWSIRVPHFYYDFYVYKYAIGQLVANIFFQKYKLSGKMYLQEYINLFLKKGGSNYPLEILKESNIDLNDKNNYLIGFDSIKEKIKLWVKLGKKIFCI